MTMATPAVAPILVFGWGNPSRGDDALGPLFVERAAAVAAASPAHADIEYLTDFQLQVEHALDLVGRQRILFVDASVRADAPFESCELRAAPDVNVTTHAMSPAAVMQVFERLFGHAPPPCTLLAIRGTRFELGEPLSASATIHLEHALGWYPGWLAYNSGADARMDAACTN